MEKEEVTPEEKTELHYGPRQVEVQTAIENVPETKLNLEGLPIEVALANINTLSDEDYTTVRRDGFGSSDISVLLGVNPYKDVTELIQEKLRTTMTAEEKAIGEKSAVKKGRDLEPLIIDKFTRYFGTTTVKPVDMYRFKDYPFLRVNFDGVTHDGNNYIPAEIKVVTKFGQKRYNLGKTMFNELRGFMPLPKPLGEVNMSIQNKAGYYGIPYYYYTQLQYQMAALNSPYGYLAALYEDSWTFHVWTIWADPAILMDAVIQGNQVWNKIQTLKGVQYGNL